jgi:hypothetical protein
MNEFENFINSILPPVSGEDMVMAISILVEECNEDSRQTAIEDPLHQMEKEIYMKLQEDAFDSGLIAEVSEMILENPGVDMVTLDKWIRNEWDL